MRRNGGDGVHRLRTERRALSGSGGVLSAGGLNIENNPGYGLFADIESIVDLALFSDWDQPTIPRALQISRPKSGRVFSADDGSSSSPIEHLLSSRIIIEAINLLLDRRIKCRLTTATGLDLNINPGPAQLTVHRKAR